MIRSLPGPGRDTTETWFFVLRGRLKLRVFQSRIMKKICGAKRIEETGDWRKVHY
jgi:hypothetical protein